MIKRDPRLDDPAYQPGVSQCCKAESVVHMRACMTWFTCSACGKHCELYWPNADRGIKSTQIAFEELNLDTDGIIPSKQSA